MPESPVAASMTAIPPAQTPPSGPWHFGGLSKGQIARRTWREMQQDEVLGKSAQLAYFFFFAIFPLAIFLTATMAMFVGPHSTMVHRLTHDLTRVMPSSATGLVRTTIHRSLANSGGGELALGIVLALLSASSGMAAMIQTLNTVFDAREERPLLKQRWTALWLTIVVGMLICAAIFLITAGGDVARAVGGGRLYVLWQVAQYPVAVFFLLVSFCVVYYFAPNVHHPNWKWVTPGAVAGVLLWSIVSFGLRVYLRHFKSYTSDYGTMGAVMVLLLWFYLTGMAFLIGGEVDAVIIRAATGRTRPRTAAAESGEAAKSSGRAGRRQAA